MSIITLKIISGIFGLLIFGICSFILRRTLSTRHQQEQQSQETILESQDQPHYGFWRSAWTVAGSAFGACLALSTVIGPLWPTELSFDSSNLYQIGSFGAPFELKNNSILFPIKIFGGHCKIIKASYSGIQIDNSTFERSIDEQIIDSGSARSFDCRAISAPMQPQYAKMTVQMDYGYVGLPWIKRSTLSDILIWDHGRFSLGDPI
ncbi:hypothetical protein [Gluconacetobacter johannae]|uniref:Transmembrane protein n=1 Tax=Gluconacetobacter johannae TaxID=112140 RepID=A0A7W4P615_9PROT|nr:hypothetical protein [Gluconacetobacter johannae]MBB2176758.1 hypothetical protein [Gluconacetobacter johannae]